MMSEQPTVPGAGAEDTGAARVGDAPDQAVASGHPEQAGAEQAGRRAIVTPSSRVTVAFPFSSIKIQEPDVALVELASLVARLAESLAQGKATSELADIAETAASLADRLRHHP